MTSKQEIIRKLLGRWSGVAYDRELSAEFQRLDEQFQKWHAGSLSTFDLSDAIHQAHSEAQKLYIYYVKTTLPNDQAVASVISRQVLKLEELQPELVECLRAHLEFFEQERSDDEVSE